MVKWTGQLTFVVVVAVLPTFLFSLCFVSAVGPALVAVTCRCGYGWLSWQTVEWSGMMMLAGQYGCRMAWMSCMYVLVHILYFISVGICTDNNGRACGEGEGMCEGGREGGREREAHVITTCT